MENYYIATFNTKKEGYKNWAINLTANNLKEARYVLENLWYEDPHNKGHMFNVEIRRLKADEEYQYNWFTRTV